MYFFSLNFQDIVGEVLKRSGVSVVLITLVHTAAFLAAAIIPIPAMRAFMFQAALVTAFNALSMILLFPAALGLDKRRVSAQKMDILCCRKNNENKNTNASSACSSIGKKHALEKYDQFAAAFRGNYQIKYQQSCAISRKNFFYK